MKIGKIVVGALSGIATGAILGVLFSPNKGSDTRRKIAKKSSDTVHDVKNKITHLMDGLAEKFEDEKEEIAEAYGRVKTKVEAFSKDGKAL